MSEVNRLENTKLSIQNKPDVMSSSLLTHLQVHRQGLIKLNSTNVYMNEKTA